MTVTSIPTKFSQGLRQKDIANTRVASESGLQFFRTGNKYVRINAGGPAINGAKTVAFTLNKTVGISTDAVLSKWNTTGGGLEYLIKIDQSGIGGFIVFRVFIGGAVVIDTADWAGLGGARLSNQVNVMITTEGGNVHRVYLNGRLYIESNTVVVYNDLGNDLFIGNQTGALDGLDGMLSNVMFFDRVLTQREITYQHNTGVPAESTHDVIEAHWAMTHKYAPLTGPNRVIDVIEQYNYAKGAPITASHGELINYTDAEVGAIEPATNISFKDLYKKGLYGWGGLNYPTGVITNRPFVQDDNAYFNLTNNFTIQVRFINDIGYRGSGTGERFVAVVGNLWIQYVNSDPRPGGAFQTRINYSGGGNTFFDFEIPTSNKIDGGEVVLTITHTSGVGTTYYVDGQLAGINPILETVVTATQTRIPCATFQVPIQGVVQELGIWDAVKNASEVANIANGGIDNASIRSRYFYNNNQGDQVIDLTGNRNQTLSLNGGVFDEAWAEAHSSIPEPRLGIQLNGTSQYFSISGFNPVKTRGYTAIVGFAVDNPTWTQSGEQFFGKRDGSEHLEVRSNGNTAMRYNNNGGAGNNATTEELNIDLSKWQNLAWVQYTEAQNRIDNPVLTKFSDLWWNAQFAAEMEQNRGITSTYNGFGDVTGDLTIGVRPDLNAATYLGGVLGYLVIWSRVLSPKEIKRYCNNSLIRNPSIIDQRNMELFVDFNNPFDDGSLKLRDLSPNNHTINVNGFANLAAVQAAQVEINSLR